MPKQTIINMLTFDEKPITLLGDEQDFALSNPTNCGVMFAMEDTLTVAALKHFLNNIN